MKRNGVNTYPETTPTFERAAFGSISFASPPCKYSLSPEKVLRKMGSCNAKSILEAEILRMVNSGKTSAAEVARLFGLHRSSVSRLISQARAKGAAIVV
jgi:predicted DNA-binding protein (UPF0251 family)